jgi:hypothetical protein
MSEEGEWQPETKFPSVGKPGNQLFRQGTCKVCRLLLMGDKPERRDWCGEHDPGRDGRTLFSDLSEPAVSPIATPPSASVDRSIPARDEGKPSASE